MNSNPRKLLLTMIIGLLVVLGCTEKLPLDPILTDDTDWNPSISISKNDYHRLDLIIDRPPRKELLRNISWYDFQYRRDASGDYQTFDSLGGVSVSPSYVYLGGFYPASHFPAFFRTRPVFEYNADYMVRMVTHYRPGNMSVSNDVLFRTPTGRGKILKRLPIPPSIASDDYSGISSFCFHRGAMIILRGRYLLQVDTSTGIATALKRDFAPRGSGTFGFLAINGDSIFTCYTVTDRNEYALVSLDLNTLTVDSTKRISAPNRSLIQMFGFGSTVFTYWQLDNSQQFATVNTRTGQLLESFPDGRTSMYVSDFCTDGKEIWGQITDILDNRIVRIDPLSMEIRELNRNPVFYPGRLSWDGKNFWVVDLETWTIAKLELEGL